VFRTVVNQEQEAGRGQTLDQAVQQGLGLSIDPVQVFADQQQRLHLTFAQQHTLECLERALTPLRWIQTQERAVLRQDIQQREQRRDSVLKSGIERQYLPRYLGPDGAGVVALLDMGIALEQVNHREIWRGLAIGHRGTLQHQPPLRAVGVDEFVDQARLADASFADQGHRLALPRFSLGQRLLQGYEVRLPPHKTRQSPGGSRLHAAVDGTRLD